MVLKGAGCEQTWETNDSAASVAYDDDDDRSLVARRNSPLAPCNRFAVREQRAGRKLESVSEPSAFECQAQEPTLTSQRQLEARNRPAHAPPSKSIEFLQSGWRLVVLVAGVSWMFRRACVCVCVSVSSFWACQLLCQAASLIGRARVDTDRLSRIWPVKAKVGSPLPEQTRWPAPPTLALDVLRPIAAGKNNNLILFLSNNSALVTTWPNHCLSPPGRR